MAYHDIDGLSGGHGTADHGQTIHLDGSGSAQLPDASYVRDAQMTRDGLDLHLEGPNGTVTVEGYFAAEHPPVLHAPDGSALTPQLVNSFLHSPAQYAQTGTANDESPVGTVQEFKGEATVTHADGTSEPVTIGTEIYQGDVIETGANGAVNIHFVDDTSFAVSQDARLAIDEYVYDPSTQSGENNFSVLKGMFVFTSGLIGRDDPDDVKIETPSGSIGIRGTIIAGDTNTGETTVIEGAIVVRDHATGSETTLDQQFETARIVPGQGVQNVGVLPAQEVAQRFAGVSAVSPTLFSSINDAAAEQGETAPADQAPNAQNGENADAPAQPQGEAPADANGSVDQNNDSQVDGTVNGLPAEDAAPASEGAIGPNGQLMGPADGALAPGMMGPAALQPAPVMMGGGLGMNPMGMASMGTGTMMNTAAMGMDPATAGTGLTTAMDPAGGVMPPPPGAGLLGTAAFQPVNIVAPPNLPPPPPIGTQPPQDPSTIGTNPPPPPPPVSTDLPPIHIASFNGTAFIDGRSFSASLLKGLSNIAKPEFFEMGEGNSWTYDFSEEFVDPDDVSNGSLHYTLTASTIGLLNSTFGAEGTYWNFDTNSGYLDIMENAALDLPSDRFIDINIQAADGGGTTGFHTYTLTVRDTGQLGTSAGLGASIATPGTYFDNPATAASVMVTANGVSIDMGDGGDTLFGTSTNSKINTGIGDDTVGVDGSNTGTYTFINLGQGNDTITLGSSADVNRFYVYGDEGDDTFSLGTNGYNVNNSRIYGGEGDNTIILSGAATVSQGAHQNHYFGGEDADKISVKAGAGSAALDNYLYGMDGDDIIALDIFSPVLRGDLQTGAAIAGILDGGDSAFDAGADIETLDPTYKHGNDVGGYGDTLLLEAVSGTQTLDFRLIDNAYIKGIERLDLNYTSNVSVVLEYGDILAMTDYKQTLIIRAGSGDNILFTGTTDSDTDGVYDLFENFTNIGSLTAVDDDYDGTTAGASVDFDVYTDGTVTLLVENNGATVTGLP